MTLSLFVTKSALRNKRRTLLTMLGVAVSLGLLTLMMSVWRGFYLDSGSAESAQRVITRHKVSLTNFLPSYYAERIRTIPGVVAIVPNSWFGGTYKDDKSGNFFAQFFTNAVEWPKVYPEYKIDPDELRAWQRDRAGAIVDDDLAKQYGWKVGQKIILKRNIYPVDPELTIRGIYHPPEATKTMYFHTEYVEEAVSWAKGQPGTFSIMCATPEAVSQVSQAVDEMFKNAPAPTKTESEKAFQLGFVNMLGNVKAFILGIGGAVVFATLLVSANTMAMAIRERTREVAVLKILGFQRFTILALFVGEAMFQCIIGGLFGILPATAMVAFVSSMGGFFAGIKMTPGLFLIAIAVAALIGFVSAIVPSYNASKLAIVDGLRHIG